MNYLGQIVERKEVGSEIEEADKRALNTTARALVNLEEESLEISDKIEILEIKRDVIIKKYNDIKDFFIKNNRKSMLAKTHEVPEPADDNEVLRKEKAVLSNYNNYWNDKINDVQKLIRIKQTLKFGNDLEPERHLKEIYYVYIFMAELHTKADCEFQSSQDENNSKEKRKIHLKNYKDIRHDLEVLRNYYKEL